MHATESIRQWPEQMKRLIVATHNALCDAVDHGETAPAEKVIDRICAEFGGERVYFPSGVTFDSLRSRKSRARRDSSKATKPIAEKHGTMAKVIDDARISCGEDA